MTGEMSKRDVTREAYPWHFAIADLLGGTVEPFDVYQGPFVDTPCGRFWLCSDDGESGYIYNESNDKSSQEFLPYLDDGPEMAACLAESIKEE